MVKAIADERGWPHDSHRDPYYQIVNELRHETGNAELAILFSAGSTLSRQSIYENACILGILWRTTFGTLSDSYDRAEGLLGAYAPFRRPGS